MRTSKENAELFLKYLQDNGCDKTGYFMEKDVEIEDEGDDWYAIQLFSQGGKMRFTFAEPSYVLVEGEWEDDIDGLSTQVYKEFNEFNRFCDWYPILSLSWTEDLGSDLKNLKE